VNRPDTSDGEVMRQVRDGAVEELGVLFERHHGRLYAFCLRMVGNPDTAADLVQEVFLRMLKYRRSYREQGTFIAWMYRLARNVCVDHLRGGGREVSDTDEALEEPAPGPLPIEQAMDRERARMLARALGRLPAEKREVILLARLAALRYSEIARVLGCTVGAVKVRVHRALRELRELYSEMANEVA